MPLERRLPRRACPRCAGTRSLSEVAAPRPSPARSARPRARTPEPGAARREVARQLGQSGEAHGRARRARPRHSSCRSRRRRRCPSDDVVPARETANVSLRRIDPGRSTPSASIAGASFSSSTGRSMPARQYTPVGQSGPRRSGRAARRPATAATASVEGVDRAVEADELMVARTDPGPAEHGAVARDTRTTSVLVLPPSNASTAGSESEGSGTDGCYVAQRGDQGGRRRRREHVHAGAGRRPVRSSRIAWSSTISSCSTRATCGARSSAGSSERILRARGWVGTFSTTADPHAALEGADFVVVQLRIGGQAARHVDETLPVGYGCLGQETVGARGLGQGAAHRADRARAGRGDGGPCQPRRVVGRLHQPGRDRDPGAARRRPPRRGPVQRRHLGPAADRALSRGRPRRRSRSSTSGSTT